MEEQKIPRKIEDATVNGKFAFISESPKNSYQDMTILPAEHSSNANKAGSKDVNNQEKNLSNKSVPEQQKKH